MERRYYGLKGVVFGVAMAMAVIYGGFSSPQAAHHAMQDYQAAALVQTALRDTGTRLTHALERLVECPRQAAL